MTYALRHTMLAAAATAIISAPTIATAGPGIGGLSNGNPCVTQFCGGGAFPPPPAPPAPPPPSGGGNGGGGFGAGAAAGLVGGIIINGLMQPRPAQPVIIHQAPPLPVAVGLSEAHIRYCFNTYASYRLNSNSYTTFSGVQKPCISPYM